MLMTVQGTTPRILLHRSPALHRAHSQFACLHPLIDDRAELRHLDQRSFRRLADRNVLFDRREFSLRRVVVVLHAADATHHFAQVQRLNRNP